MRISFERRGGFAGISKKKSVDTATLSAKEVQELSRLVEVADLFKLPEEIVSSNSQGDRFQYRVTIEDNDQQHTVTVSETALPENLRLLIEWLNNI